MFWVIVGVALNVAIGVANYRLGNVLTFAFCTFCFGFSAGYSLFAYRSYKRTNQEMTVWLDSIKRRYQEDYDD